MPRALKYFLLTLLALPVLLMVAALALWWWQPVPITDWRVLLNAVTGQGAAIASEQIERRLQAPPGFSVNVYARDLPMVRFLHVTTAGDVLATRPRAGEVILLERDRNGDGVADGRRVLLSGLDRPHGIDVADGWLYIGENTTVGRVRFDAENGRVEGDYQHIVSGLTGEGNHWTKTVRIGPDGKLYMAQGSTCNVCEETDERRATMMRFNADGSGGEILARGLRNSVGFDWAPWDGALYATDNGRDLLGDAFPPCELNRIEAGGFYGWPYLNGANVLDPDLGAGKETLRTTAIPPAHAFRAHNAPLGIRFVDAEGWPEEYRRSALVALHGSWNRSKPDGYEVVSLHWGDDGTIEERPFLSGFEFEGDIIGRPVDVAQGSDGAVFVSDDYAGAIYRVVRSGGVTGMAQAVAPAKPAVKDRLAPLDAAQRTALNQQGAALFRRYGCGNCHERARMGRTIRPLTEVGSRYDLASLMDFFVAPTPPMPVFPLSEEERQALAVYLLERAAAQP